MVWSNGEALFQPVSLNISSFAKVMITGTTAPVTIYRKCTQKKAMLLGIAYRDIILVKWTGFFFPFFGGGVCVQFASASIVLKTIHMEA